MARRRQATSPSSVDDGDGGDVGDDDHEVEQEQEHVDDGDDDEEMDEQEATVSSDDEQQQSQAQQQARFKPGSIIRIKLRNFLTHESVEFYPGPRLNMVIGANGTGKSTILNAICLGLGGEPKLLGRADDARAFIMHGRSKAEVEIEIQGHGPGGDGASGNDDDDGDGGEDHNNTTTTNHVFRRLIDASKGSERGKGRGASTFYVNGEKSNIKTIRQICAEKYNIAIDNLCTFLPQDKVGSFSGCHPVQILEATEKTLSTTGHLYNIHQELILAEKEMSTHVQDIDSIRAELRKLEREHARLQANKELFEEREAALHDLDILQKKKLWLEFDKVRGQALEVKEQRAALKKLLQESIKSLQPLQQKVDRLSAKKQEMEHQFKSLDKTTKKLHASQEKQLTKFQNHDDEIERVLSDMGTINQRKQALEDAVAKARAELDKVVASQRTVPPSEDVERAFHQAREARAAATKQHQATRRNVTRLVQERREYEDESKRLDTNLRKINDVAASRRRKVFQQYPVLKRVDAVIEQNRAAFRKTVHGPIACEIATQNAESAAFVEQYLPAAVLKAYVVECKADYDLLYGEIRQRMKLPINIINVGDGRSSAAAAAPQRIYSNQKWKRLKTQHGITAYLDETFTCPDPVMQALRDQVAVQKAIVGDAKTQHSIDTAGLLDYLSQPEQGWDGFNKNNSTRGGGPQPAIVFTTTAERKLARYTVGVSRYSNTTHLRIDDIDPAKMLGQGVDVRRRTAAEEELAKVDDALKKTVLPQLTKLESQLREEEIHVQRTDQKFQHQKKTKEMLQKMTTKRDLKTRKWEQAVAELKAGNDDGGREKRALVDELMARVRGSLTALEHHHQLQTKAIATTIQNAGINVNTRVLTANERQAKLALNEKKQENTQLEKEATEVNQKFTAMKREVAKLKAEAEKEALLQDADGEATPLKAELEAIEVETLEQCDVAIEDAQQKVDSIAHDKNAIREFDRCQREMERTKQEIEDYEENRNSNLVAINNKRQAWEMTLDDAVGKISKGFAKYMGEMGLVGDVRLTKGDGGGNGDDDVENHQFATWGIEILVSFREKSKLQVLSARVHSGGERSVSTIMYLMALQDMMVSPFRCVDEINQGLDERNERLVFQRIVSKTTALSAVGNNNNANKKQKKKRRNAADDDAVTTINHSGQYFLITPKLLPNLSGLEEDGITILFVVNGPFNNMTPQGWDIQTLARQLLQNRRRRLADGDADEEEDDAEEEEESTGDDGDDEENAGDGNSKNNNKKKSSASRRQGGGRSKKKPRLSLEAGGGADEEEEVV